MTETRFALQKKQEALQQTDTQGDKIKESKYPVIEYAPPIDFSFLHLTCVEDAEKEEPRVPALGSLASSKDEKFDGRCLRINNNILTDVKNLKIFIDKTFKDPANIGWLDLSFNGLKTIDDAIVECKHLQILYLHSNKISSLKDVDKLASLTKLHKLTLHGNPIEEQKGYRMHVLSSLPLLRSFDFSAVTKCESRTAQCWKGSSDKRKKKKSSDDD